MLRLSQTDVYNDALGDITTTGTTDTEYGSLNIDYQYGTSTQYTFDITSYITSQLAVSENNENGLVISPPQPAFSTSFNRAVFGDKANEKGKVQLLLYYITAK